MTFEALIMNSPQKIPGILLGLAAGFLVFGYLAGLCMTGPMNRLFKQCEAAFAGSERYAKYLGMIERCIYVLAILMEWPSLIVSWLTLKTFSDFLGNGGIARLLANGAPPTRTPASCGGPGAGAGASPGATPPAGENADAPTAAPCPSTAQHIYLIGNGVSLLLGVVGGYCVKILLNYYVLG